MLNDINGIGNMLFTGALPQPQLSRTAMPGRAVDAPRPLKVIYIGAGVSGIVAAIHFKKFVPSLDLIIYEKNEDLGGTWFENRYPGCACDVPSHAYQLSFESSPDWNEFYAGGKEIWEYWNKVAAKYEVRNRIRFRHKCLEASWSEVRSKWTVKLERDDESGRSLIEDEADVFITGTGILNEMKWPDIKGLYSFDGSLLHTAAWDETFNPTGKSVAVIGAGSSGIQVVPAIASKVKSMDHYVRSKTWICSQFNEDMLKDRTAGTGSDNFRYDATEKEAWKKDPAAYLRYRKTLETGMQSLYELTLRDSIESKNARSQYETNMREKLRTKPGLSDFLIPQYSPLCKRLTPGPGYLEALTEPHITVVSESIAYIDHDSVVTTDGTFPGQGFPIYGRDGLNLRDKYQNRPETYLGCCTDGFPNFFQSLGPNSWQGSGSLLVMIEYTHLYMAQILKRLAYDNIRSIEPRRKPVKDFTNFCEQYFKKTVYTDKCIGWYKSTPPNARNEEREAANVTALWPGSCLHALHVMSTVRWEDFELEVCNNNDFGWFGNGRTASELGIEHGINTDITWYLNGTKFLHEPRQS